MALKNQIKLRTNPEGIDKVTYQFSYPGHVGLERDVRPEVKEWADTHKIFWYIQTFYNGGCRSDFFIFDNHENMMLFKLKWL